MHVAKATLSLDTISNTIYRFTVLFYVNHNLDQVWCIGDENVISDSNVDATFHFKLNNSGEGSMQKMIIASV